MRFATSPYIQVMFETPTLKLVFEGESGQRLKRILGSAHNISEITAHMVVDSI